MSQLTTAGAFLAWFFLFFSYFGIGITLGYHRLLTHKSLVVPPWLRYAIVSGGYLCFMGGPVNWVGVHRLHHQKSDLPEDPHSPMIEGSNKVMWEGAELYRIESRKQETQDNYGHNTPDDWLERNLYSGRTNKLGIAIMFVINVLLFGPLGITSPGPE